MKKRKCIVCGTISDQVKWYNIECCWDCYMSGEYDEDLDESNDFDDWDSEYNNLFEE